MSAGMDALAIQRTLANGKPRTHSELIIAVGFGGSRMRAAIALLVRDGLIHAETLFPANKRSDYNGQQQCWRAP
jgi:hypothetical protein